MGDREVWASAAFEILKEVAQRYHAVIEYGELGEEIQHRTRVSTRMGIQNWIGPVLGKVLRRCVAEGVPPLTSLVVRKHTGMVGEGYDEVLVAMGVTPLQDTMERERHAAESRLRCYQWADAHDLPADGGEPALAPRLAENVSRERRRQAAQEPPRQCPNCHYTLPMTGMCDNCE